MHLLKELAEQMQVYFHYNYALIIIKKNNPLLYIPLLKLTLSGYSLIF